MLTEKELYLLEQLGVTKLKVCSKCGMLLPISSFEPNRRYSDGYRGQCHSCRLLEHKIYYQRNKARIDQRNEITRLLNPQRYWVYSTISGHKKRGCTILFSKQDLIVLAHQTDTCGICGCKLNWSRVGKSGSPMSNSPSLDRINQEKVLTMENIQIICTRCNMSKNARTMQEFSDYCKKVAEVL